MANMERSKLRIVVKIGTSSLLKESSAGMNLALGHLAATVETLSELRAAGHDVVLVSSGAVGAGCHRMGLNERPGSIVARQALASVGQVVLMGKYDLLFSSLGQMCSQVLLTYENFVDRVQFLNAKNTFDELFKIGAVPIVNENDTVGIHELKADNDKLAAMVGNMIGADLVFLMTDVNGVYTANPHKEPDAKRIEFVRDIAELRQICKLGDGQDSDWGTGGMAAKISAASLSTSLGVRTVIMQADDCEKIISYVSNEAQEIQSGKLEPERFTFGTTFERNADPPRERKRWIRSIHRRGTLTVDEGAKKAIAQRKTLFAVGITSVQGEFTAFEAVSVVDSQGKELAYGLCNFSSSDLKKIRGMNSEQVFELLGQSGAVVERENMDFQIDRHDLPSSPMKAVPPSSDDQESEVASVSTRPRGASFSSGISNPSFTPPVKNPSFDNLGDALN